LVEKVVWVVWERGAARGRRHTYARMYVIGS
jgi:hypothetical protein